jgi:hypothetical protein
MSTVARVSPEELDVRLDYLRHHAGPCLSRKIAISDTLGGNRSKVVEELRMIAKAARECALALEALDAEEAAP